MRLGVTLAPGDELAAARASESVGLPFVHVAAAPGTESAIAAAVIAETTSVRVIVGLHVGDEHPVTLAEEIAVLDNLANGRIGVIAELGTLSADDAIEDVTVLRESWSGRPLAHRGRRWRVPAGLPGHTAPEAVMVTPQPAQLQLPLWIAGEAADAVAAALSLPAVATSPPDVDRARPVSPARTNLSGALDTDRQAVIEWAAAGTTHLLCEPDGADLGHLARWLVPEVGMVGFPRIVAQAPLPAAWPGHSGH